MGDRPVLQDAEASIENHQRFVRRVVQGDTVWGLKSDAGWAVCDSAEYDEMEVMPFWSDRAYAQRAAQDEWADYVPTPIPLDTFIDRWLKGMHRDGVLVGPNWDAHNCGRELDALDLASELVDAQAQQRKH